MSNDPAVAIVGVTGAVGAEFIVTMDKRGVRVGKLKALAGARSAGKTVSFRGKPVVIEELTERAFEGVDIALFSAGSGADHGVGALLVIEDGGKLVGVFSELDYARKVILKGKSSRSTTVGELMSSPPICASPDMSLQDCMVLMTNNHVRHLPVMDNGEVIGIVSIGDVVGSIMRSQEATINQLENYITGDDYPARVVAH